MESKKQNKCTIETEGHRHREQTRDYQRGEASCRVNQVKEIKRHTASGQNRCVMGTRRTAGGIQAVQAACRCPVTDGHQPIVVVLLECTEVQNHYTKRWELTLGPRSTAVQKQTHWKRYRICGYQRWGWGRENWMKAVRSTNFQLKDKYAIGMWSTTTNTTKINVKGSHHKDKYFAFSLYLWDGACPLSLHCANYWIRYVSEIIIPYTLKLYSAIMKINLNKTGS